MKEVYIVEIEIKHEDLCAKVDPFGLCDLFDCMKCGNADVKIIKQEPNK